MTAVVSLCVCSFMNIWHNMKEPGNDCVWCLELNFEMDCMKCTNRLCVYLCVCFVLNLSIQYINLMFT